MKIIHLNNDDSAGGASKFSERLVSLQRKSGLGSELIVGKKYSNQPWVHLLPIKRDVSNYREYYTNGFLYFWNLYIDLVSNRLIHQSPIVHIHNISGNYLNPQSLVNLVDHKPVVWTLHDKFLLTGHCSQPLDCERWQEGCGSCPNLSIYPAIQRDATAELLEWKRENFANRGIHFVLPSKEMEKAFAKSHLKDESYSIIPNGIDTSLFKPIENVDEIKSKYGIPKDKIIIMGSAIGGVFSNGFKGSSLFKAVLFQLEKNYKSKVVFLNVGVTGQDAVSSEDDFIFNVPYIYVDEEYAELIAISDIFLFPSLMESFGLAPLEAMSCGVSVVCSNVGILSEVIKNGINGFLIEEYNEKNFLDTLIHLINTPKLRRSIQLEARTYIEENYSIEDMNASYNKLYSEILSRDSRKNIDTEKSFSYRFIIINKYRDEAYSYNMCADIELCYLKDIDELWNIEESENELIYVYFEDEKHPIDVSFFSEIVLNNLNDEVIYTTTKSVFHGNTIYLHPTIIDKGNQSLINIAILPSFVFRLNILRKYYYDFIHSNEFLVNTFSAINGGYYSISFTEVFNMLTSSLQGKIYIYGFGGHTTTLINQLKENQIKAIKGIVHKGKSGSSYKGLLVTNIDEISVDKDCVFLISSKSFEEEIFLELCSRFPENKIIRIYGT